MSAEEFFQSAPDSRGPFTRIEKDGFLRWLYIHHPSYTIPTLELFREWLKWARSADKLAVYEYGKVCTHCGR